MQVGTLRLMAHLYKTQGKDATADELAKAADTLERYRIALDRIAACFDEPGSAQIASAALRTPRPQIQCAMPSRAVAG